jgi:hypothetical protein
MVYANTCCRIREFNEYLFLNIWNKYLTNIILAMNLSYKLWFYMFHHILLLFYFKILIFCSPHHNWQSLFLFSLILHLWKINMKLQLKELTTKQENAGAIPSNAIFIYQFQFRNTIPTLMIWSQTTTNKLLFFWWCMCWTLRIVVWNKTLVWQVFRNW